MEKEEGDCGYGTFGGFAAGRGMEQASSDAPRSTDEETAQAIANAVSEPCGAKEKPRAVVRPHAERRSNGVSETCRLRRGERYGVCCDDDAP